MKLATVEESEYQKLINSFCKWFCFLWYLANTKQCKNFTVLGRNNIVIVQGFREFYSLSIFQVVDFTMIFFQINPLMI